LPSVRCENFNDLLWTYVSEIAKIRKISRCKALEKVVEEHMKFMAMKQHEMEGKRSTSKKAKKKK